MRTIQSNGNVVSAAQVGRFIIGEVVGGIDHKENWGSSVERSVQDVQAVNVI